VVSAQPLSLLGPLLRRYRMAAGLTQEELAERAGLSTRAISDLERGVKRAPRRETVELLADALALTTQKRALFASTARPGLEPAAMPVAVGPPSNLPAQPTPLIARERELRAIHELLGRPDTRLLTLTGPGGVGKTRLALAAADELLPRFEDGVWLVELAAIRDPALVVQAVARAIRLRETGDQPPDVQLHEALRSQQALLILDNFEHVVQAAPVVARLLAACPRIRILATSREPLRLRGERELKVEPLADDPASELFLARARDVRPDLPADAETLAAVREVCRRLDGLPLALELAAVHVRALSPQLLLDRLTRRLPLLNAGPRDLPDRQRTMRDAIAWSEHLLSPDDQRLFCRLAVFAGGWSLAAAEAICALPGEPATVLESLLSLAEKSLVRAGAHDGEPRFSMLETVREYAQERLDASGEADALRRRHAERFASLADVAARIQPGQDERDRTLRVELPNAQVAMRWAHEHGELEIGLRLAAGFARLWFISGAVSEAERWLRIFLTLDAQAGERAAPPTLRLVALFGATRCALDRRDYAEAEARASEGLALARRLTDAAGTANMLAELGHVAEARGDLDAAWACFEESLALARTAGDGAGEGRALSSLGNLARRRHDYARATHYLEASLAHSRAYQLSWGIAGGLVALGHVACEQGAFDRAADLYRESLELYRAMPNPAWLAWCLEGVAVVAAARGRHHRAARLVGAVNARRSAALPESTPWPPYVEAGAHACAALGEQAFAEAESQGALHSAEQAIAEALRALAATGSGQ
jgi:predicted ATPase/DNA-binding XRE family transcriptional regulator